MEKTVPTGLNCTKYYIREEIDKFINNLPFEVERVGIALPGLVIDGNKLQSSDVLPGLDLVDTTFFSRGKYAVKFINDVKAATLTESAVYKNAHTVAVIMVGTGIAAGVAIEGKLVEGSQGFAGEIGYAYVPYGEKIERFDNLSSGAAILKKSNCSAEELVKRLNEGCINSKKIVEEAGYYFGIALGLMIQFYNPEVIVVGGGTSTYPGFMEVARETAKKCTLPELYNHCNILPPEDTDRIVAKWGLLFD